MVSPQNTAWIFVSRSSSVWDLVNVAIVAVYTVPATVCRVSSVYADSGPAWSCGHVSWSMVGGTCLSRFVLKRILTMDKAADDQA